MPASLRGVVPFHYYPRRGHRPVGSDDSPSIANRGVLIRNDNTGAARKVGRDVIPPDDTDATLGDETGARDGAGIDAGRNDRRDRGPGDDPGAIPSGAIGDASNDRAGAAARDTTDAAFEAHYQAHWRAFRAARRVEPAPTGRRGRHERVVAIVRITDGSLFRRLDRIRAAVAVFPFIAPVPDHSLHLPIVDLGPLARRGARADEWTPAMLDDLVERAAALLDGAPSFAFELARVNVVAGEVLAEVHPVRPVLALRQLIARVTAPRDRDFLPRLPLARITAPGEAAPLADALEWFRDRPIGRVQVTSVTLVTMRRAGVFPIVRRFGEVPLGPG